MSKYLFETFEPSSLGVMQGLTDLAHGQPLCDHEGTDYFKLFESLQIPLLVICADRDDLVNMEDSLRCFENSTSKDKAKLVYISDNSRTTATYGHCDIVVGKQAVTHVWEKIRIWLDQRRKLGVDLYGVSPSEYIITEYQSGDLVPSSDDQDAPSESLLDKILVEVFED